MSNNSESQRAYESELSDDWLDRLARFNQHFGRFVRDVLGVVFIAAALIIFLALRGSTSGVLLTPWVGKLALWFGWGAYLVAIAIGYAGYALLRRSVTPLPWGRLFALEVAAFLTLGLLAALNGNSLVRAEAGADGGRIGWGMVTLFWRLGRTGGTLLMFIPWLLALMGGFNLWALIERGLTKFAGETPPVEMVVLPEAQEEPSVVEEKKEKQPRKKTEQLPPEFRKSLRVSEHQDKKPAAPRERDERLPSLNILLNDQNTRPDERTINQTAGMIEKTLAEFGIVATVIGFRVGPTITQFAVQPGFMKRGGANTEEEAQQIKVRVAQIASLQKDLALALSAERLRIEAPVPGKPYIGIEVPNSHTSVVRMRSILETDAFHKIGTPLAMALGRDVSGQPVVADLARMPHLLIAGATGSGKSVCITAIAACLAMNNPPEDLRMVMIDSKMVELLRFNGLPHLYGKVETNIERILGVLRWVVVEMEHRYRLLEAAHARDLENYNRRLSRKKDGMPLPRIVVLIDELADLMMSAPDQTEHNLVRLAQMARATGIHLIVATQRPSTDVVTGLIKANFPARIAFQVSSKTDSRTILDANGAEALLGRGDMLYLASGTGRVMRLHGSFVSDDDVRRVVEFVKEQATPAYNQELLVASKQEAAKEEDSLGEVYEQAKELVLSTGQASASLIQRRLRVGYPRAARMIEQMEVDGLVGAAGRDGRREVVGRRGPVGAEEQA